MTEDEDDDIVDDPTLLDEDSDDGWELAPREEPKFSATMSHHQSV